MQWISLLSILLYITTVSAKSAACIVHDLNVIREQILRVDCTLETFNGYGGIQEPLNLGHNLKRLLSLSVQNSQLNSLLEDLADDLQESCPFNSEDSTKILTAFATLEAPLGSTLDTFEKKHGDFSRILGPFVAHRAIGGSIKITRCNTLEVLNILEARIEKEYKEIVSGVAGQVDSEFQAVISVY